MVPLKWRENGVYGDLIIIYPKPYSIYLRGTIGKTIYWELFMSWGLGVNNRG